MQLTTPRKAALTTIAVIGLVGGLFAPAAGANGKSEAPGQAKKNDSAQVEAAGKPAKGDRDGDADRNPGTSYTEDNDTNDGGTKNNVADSGDNRHPSGKDRSVEHGKSGNQGKAESDPDNNGKGPERNSGGPDKPNGSGGVDKADQDGNNGCGNDDDFEDDNEGWCGRKPKADKPEAAKPAESPKHEDKPKGNDKPKSDDTGKPGKVEGPVKAKPCPKGGGKTDGMGKGCGHSCSKGGGHEKGKGKGHTEDCPSTGGTSTSCPAGTVDTNGSMPGGCVTPGGAVAGAGATAIPTTTTTVDDDDDDYVDDDAPEGEVLDNSAEKPGGTSAERPASAEAVRAASASGAEVFSVGALAFTGASISILLAVALALLLVGFVLVRSTRRREVPVQN